MEATATPSVPARDRAAVYADLVRKALAAAPEPLSAKELQDVCGLSERLVRDGLERLTLSGELVTSRRYVAHRRGLPPVVYAIRNA